MSAKKLHVMYGFSIAALIIVIIALIAKFMVLGNTQSLGEGRRAILLAPAERSIVLKEMREMLVAVQGITAALARRDMGGVATAARPMGMQAAQHVEVGLAAKLPLEFKSLGHNVHQDFDRMALDAESLGDATHTLEQLTQTLGKCVACHASFELSLATARK